MHAAQIINSAQRPLIYFGGGVRSAGAGDALRQLVQKAQIPATYTLMAAGVLDYGDPLNLGLLGMHGSYTTNKAASKADVLIAVGTRFSDRVALDPGTFAQEATIIQFDIDASEIGKNVEVDCSVVGDAKVVLEALLPTSSPRPIRMDAAAAELAVHRLPAQGSYRPADAPSGDRGDLRTGRAGRGVCDRRGPAPDVGLPVHPPRERPAFLTSGGLGTMGFGYGAALGAQAALGRDQTVVMMTGDGSFHMNLNEACTAVSYDLPVITIIFNNQVLGMVRQWQTAFYGKRYSSTDPHRKTDYVKLAEGFGLKGYHCETVEEFRAALPRRWPPKSPPGSSAASTRTKRCCP